MPRYDDRYGTTRLYVGHLSSRTRSRDLEHIFSRYGRVQHVDMKHDFAFVEFSDPRDADDAMYYLDGREVDGSRLVVEFAKGVPRGPGGSREYMGRGPTPGSGRCFNCGIDGHWARDCKAGDWKNKCYRCGSRGHIQRNCQNSPRKLTRRDRSYSRSPVRSRSPRHGRRQSRSLSQSRSYSQSRSPPKREHQRRDKKRTRSPSYSRSPEPKKARKPSLTPEKEELSPIERALSPSPSPSPSPTPKRAKLSTEGDMSESPRNRSRSPMSPERDSPVATRYESPPPPEANGRSPSPSRKHDRSPIDDYDDEKNHESPRGSESS